MAQRIYTTTHQEKHWKKSGLYFVETFEKNCMLFNWFKITKEQWHPIQ